MSIATVLLEGERILTWVKGVRLMNNPFIRGNFWLDTTEFTKRVKIFHYQTSMDPTITGFFYLTNYRMLFVEPKTGSFVFAVPYKLVNKYQMYAPKADRSGVYINPTYTFSFELFTSCTLLLEMDNPPEDRRQIMAREFERRINSPQVYLDAFPFEHGIAINVKPSLEQIIKAAESVPYQSTNVNLGLVSHYWDKIPKRSSLGWQICDYVQDFLRMGVMPFDPTKCKPDEPIKTQRCGEIAVRLSIAGIDQYSSMTRNAKYINSYPHMAKYFNDPDLIKGMSHVDSLSNGWRMTTANLNYQLCDTYPAIIALPNEFLRNGNCNALLQAITAHRSRGRLPILSYRNPITGASLSRCAQPNSGITNKQSSEDEYLLSTIRGTSIIVGDVRKIVEAMDKRGELGKKRPQSKDPSAENTNDVDTDSATAPIDISVKLDSCNYAQIIQKRIMGILKDNQEGTTTTDNLAEEMSNTNYAVLKNGPPVVLLFDCRPRVAAMVNGIMGKGTEKTSDMGKVIFLNIDNIHKVREAYESMRSLHMYRPSNCFRMLGVRRIEGGQMTTVGLSPNGTQVFSGSGAYPSTTGGYPIVGATADDLDAFENGGSEISTSVSQNFDINYSTQGSAVVSGESYSGGYTSAVVTGQLPTAPVMNTSLPPWMQAAQANKQQMTSSAPVVNMFTTNGTCVTNSDLNITPSKPVQKLVQDPRLSYSYASSMANDPSYMPENSSTSTNMGSNPNAYMMNIGMNSASTTSVDAIPQKKKGFISKIKGKIRGTSAVEKGLSATSVRNVLSADKVISNRKVSQIHSSLHPLGESLKLYSATHIAEDDNLLKGITESTYYYHIRTILAGALIIAQQMTDSVKGMTSYNSDPNVININRYNCIVHCSDGWDRTSLLAALSSILQDPFYRTVYGFIQITEREFGNGHMYSTRSRNIGSSKLKDKDDKDSNSSNGYSYNSMIPGTQGQIVYSFSESQVSPIFVQYIECVRCIQKQFPTQFEFNEEFLLFILYHLYAGRFGTFLFDCEHDRVIYGSPILTMSVWDPMIESIDESQPNYRKYVWKSRFLNQSFSWDNFDKEMKYAGTDYLDINLSQYKISPWKRFWRQNFSLD